MKKSLIFITVCLLLFLASCSRKEETVITTEPTETTLIETTTETTTEIEKTSENTDDISYWQGKYPDAEIKTFFIHEGENEITCYFVDEELTVEAWCDTEFNTQLWHKNNDFLLNKDETYKIEKLDEKLTPFCTVEAVKVEQEDTSAPGNEEDILSSLKSDEKTFVYSMNKGEYNVYSIDKDKVTGLKSYTEYSSEDEAAKVYKVCLMVTEKQAKSVKQNGKWIIKEYNKSAYEGLSAKTLKEAFADYEIK